jgi:hypothetical protein
MTFCLPVSTNSSGPIESLADRMKNSYRLFENRDELQIGVRFLSVAAAGAMLTGLAVFWGLLFYVGKRDVPIIAIEILTSGFALFLALYSSRVEVKAGRLEIYSFPFGRRRRVVPEEIETIFCQKVRTVAGRGGVVERYALMAQMRDGARKPITFLYGFEREDEAVSAGCALTRRLNAIRPSGAEALMFNGS